VRSNTSLSIVLTILLIGAFAAAPAASAQDRDVRFHGLGPRVGLSITPNQFVFGGHADFGDPLPHTNLLLPVVEIGVGDNVTTTSLGSDLLFRFSDRWGVWTPYLGGEGALIITSEANSNGNDNSEARLGLSGIFGVEKVIGESNRFAAELKFEIVNAPNVKLMAIWAFGH
jgi:hypothetical protein